jgi:hypothetical protein
MKLLLLIILIIFFQSCHRQKLGAFIPKEFYYPDDSIGSGKTFTYHDSANNKYKYTDLKLIYSENKKLIVFVSYDSILTRDSVIELNHKVIDWYKQLGAYDSTLVKAEGLVDMTIDDNSRLGKNKISIFFQNDIISEKISTEKIFVKDTSMIWNGKYFDCLIMESNGKFEIRSHKYPSLNYNLNAIHYSYFAKGIGQIEMSDKYRDRKGKNHFDEWYLSSIKDIVSRNKINSN